MEIRKAHISEAKEIQNIISEFASRGEMLPRSLGELYEHIRDYFVCIDEDGTIAGVCALHIMWSNLAEIRSLAVHDGYSGQGVGSQLMKACLEEARKIGIAMVFALTYRPGFFERFHFKVADKSTLPQKIWTDCLKCSKFPDCDETAVIYEMKRAEADA